MQTRKQKEQIIAEVVEKIQQAKALVFADFKGLSVKDLTILKKELRATQSEWLVLKKTLLNIALEKAGIQVNARSLEGQVSISFSSDEVSAAKVIAPFAKKNDKVLRIIGGALGTTALDVAQVQALAKLPSQDELRGQLVGTLQAPITGFVRALSGNLSGLVRVLQAVAEQKA
ncbi:MAG: 50S ribosomal protein L10 [Candidatus Moraniibacteriota bacterium]